MSIIPLDIQRRCDGGGPPDFVGRLTPRGPKASLNNNSFPCPPKPKEKPTGLKRRARDFYRRCERGTEAPRHVVTAFAGRAPQSAAGYAFSSSGAGASLIALLHYLANHGSDRLLISHRHRRDHRCELGPGRVRAQPNRVILEDASLPSSSHSRFTPCFSVKLAISWCLSFRTGLISSSERSRDAAISLSQCDTDATWPFSFCSQKL